MAGTTTKLALYLPGGGLSGLITPDEQVDIDKINDNMKKIDTAIGFVVCTSGTRPSTPFTGQSIIETDTRNTMYWNGTRWVPMDALPNAATDIARDALYPVPVAGNRVYRTDTGATQAYNGTAWLLSAFSAEQHGAAGGVALTASVLTTVATINLPANAPAGNYMVFYSITTGAGAIAVHYQRVTWAGVEITAYTADYLNNVPANTDISKSDQILKLAHPGGATAIILQTQVNAASAAMRFCRLNVLYVGP